MDAKVFGYVFSRMEKRMSHVLEHCERTAALCYITAQELNLKAEDLEIAYMAGLLHDIGKLDFSPTIKLQDKEIDINQIYPYFSASILNNFEGFESVSETVLQTEENIDGSGYPMGLKEDEIGPIARILRIADYYDTCRMGGLSHDETTKKLRENSDIIFPRKIITPFIKAVITNELHQIY